MLRGHGIRAVLGAGLSPPLGLFHRGRSNYFNLVDDLIEPFRPVVDYVALGAPGDAVLDDHAVRRALVEASFQRFAPTGESAVTSLETLAQRLGRYVEGELEKLEVPAWIGPEGGGEVDESG